MSLRNLPSILVIVSSIPAAASAQFSAEAVVGASLARLSSQDASLASDGAPVVSASVEHLSNGERLRVFYSIDGGALSTEQHWQFLQQGAGARYRLSPAEGFSVHVGPTVALRTNGGSWASTGYHAIGGFANLEHASPFGSLRGGIRSDRRVFQNQPDLNHVETAAFVSVLKSFRTRTTVIGEAAAGWKRYDTPLAWSGSETVAQPADEPAFPQPISGAVQGAQRGQAAGARIETWRRPDVLPHVSATNAGIARQLSLFGRVAQSIADRWALSVEASHRAVGGVIGTAVISTPQLLVEDGVYDDPYTNRATMWRAGSKTSSAAGRTVEAGVARWQKRYPTTPAGDVDGRSTPGVFRRDAVWRLDASWREPMGRISWPFELAAITEYTFVNSNSNDVYYTYRAHRLRVAVSVGY